MPKEYWITNSRFRIILIVFFLFWLGLMILFYLKADEVTKNPCSICAEKIGDEVYCTTSGGTSVTSIRFYPNYSIIFEGGEKPNLNFSLS